MNLVPVNDARLATFECCQMDIGDVGFILMNKIEKQVLHELCQVLQEYLTCIFNLAFSLCFGIDKD